jgi:hypothetical protein
MAQIILQEGVAQATPSTGNVTVYAKSDGLVYSKDDAGIETPLGGGGDTLPVADTTAVVMGSADNTKLLRFEVDGFTTGTTRVITPPNEDFTMVGVATTQTLTNKTIDGDLNTISDINYSSLASDVQTALGLGFKNKIIGGNFTTNPWQRGTSFAAIATGAYSADRWLFINTSAGVVSSLKTADAPTVAQAGVFTQHCLHIDVTTADAAVAAGDDVNIQQRIEGLNASYFGFGQAGTRNITLSFWHKHTKTGTHCVSLRNSAANRSYVAEYTQTTTDTWQKSTVTFPVDTSGTWLYDTGIGLTLTFALMAGTTFQTTANTWAAGSFTATSSQVNNLDSTSNNFKIALVQLEVGQTATAFDNRSYSQEKALCTYYFWRWTTPRASGCMTNGRTGSTTLADFVLSNGPMRVSPTVTFTGDLRINDTSAAAAVTSVSNVDYNSASGSSYVFLTASGGGLTAGRGCVICDGGANTATLSASAEL